MLRASRALAGQLEPRDKENARSASTGAADAVVGAPGSFSISMCPRHPCPEQRAGAEQTDQRASAGASGGRQPREFVAAPTTPAPLTLSSSSAPGCAVPRVHSGRLAE